MKNIKAADLEMGQWTDQTFEAESFDDLMKQVYAFMSSDPVASADPKAAFTEEMRASWMKTAQGVWDVAPEI